MWTWFNNLQFKGFFKDEYSLLVSFDIIPLRGLDETRELLNQKGKIITGDFSESPDLRSKNDRFFIPFLNGKPDVDAIDWGCDSQEYIPCLATLCAFITSTLKLQFSKKDRRLLRDFFLRELSPDLRIRRALVTRQPLVESFLLAQGWEIKLSKFVPHLSKFSSFCF